MADLSKIIKGGLSKVRNASRSADEAMEAKRLAREAANPPIKASEAYGKHEGAYMKPIFYDRMKVDLSKGKLGGPGFSGIQLVDPNYAQAKAVAGVTDKKMATRILNRNTALVPKGADVIWTPSVGGLEQHKSNSTMFGEFADIFSSQRKNMSAEEIQRLSDRASNMTDNKGRLIFPNGIDLGSRNFRQQVKTYDQRSLMADIFAGRGVGGEKGRTVPVEELLEKNLDPNMAEAGTLDLGNRLFRLDGSVIDRPDLHTDYRMILTGDDLDVNYLPVPIKDVYGDWEANKLLELAAQGKNRPVTMMDYTKNDPTVQLTEELLTKLQKAGKKDGGEVDGDQELKAMIADHLESQRDDPELRSMIEGYMAGGEVGMAGGGKMVKKAFKKLFNDDVLPAAERDANLQKFLEPSKTPMRLYHGTTASEGGKGQEAIRRIKPSKEGALGSGVYLTPSSAHASGYSGIPNDDAIAAMLSSQHHADTGLKALNQRNSGNILPSQEGGNMLPVHAQIRNPLIIEGTHGDPMIEALMKLGMDENSASRMVERAYENKGYIGKEVENRARAAGYDGLMQYRGGDLSEVVSYNPSAVKSAIGNRGTYDISEPDLGKADGGKIVKGAVKGFKKLFAEPATESKVIQPPSIIIPSKLTELRKTVQKEKGDYGSRRLERAADEIPNLDKLYKEQALREAFLGDNAKAVMTMNPRDFENYSHPLDPRFMDANSTRHTTSGERLPYPEYMSGYLPNVGAFNDVPYLLINKEEQGLPLMPFISGHEGRHRSRVMAGKGEKSGLVQLSPRAELREPFPRRSQEEYIEALKRELEMTDNMVLPEGFERPPLKLPDIYADGGLAMAKGGKMVKGLKRLFSDPTESSTASRGTRKFEDGAGGLNIVKEPDGNWITSGAGSPANALKSLKTYVPSEEALFLADRATPIQAAEARARSIPDAALNKWVDSNLTNYVKKQMGTKDDPVRKLAEEGVVHMPPRDFVYNMHGAQKKRAELGQPQLGQSDAAKAWENNTDVLIDVAPAGEYTKPLTPTQARQGFKSLVDTNPWLEKVAPETPINAIKTDARGNLGFDHIMDVLRIDLEAGRIRPEQLNKVSMEQAVRRTYEYDQEMAKRMRDAQIKVTEGMPVHKDYADKGYKWIELTKPDTPTGLPEGWALAPNSASEKTGLFRAASPTGETVLGQDMPDLIKNLYTRYPDAPGNPRKQLETALKYEGNTMGHCVGSYCDDVASGKSRIYSLRDAKGEPHVTIEVEPQNEKGYYNSLNPDKRAELMSQAIEYRRQTVPDIDPNKSPDERAKMLKDYLDSQNIQIPSRIKQIKGKQNAAPKEEYVPFVQDFVRSGEWSDVGDLSNTGLIPANAIKAAGHDMTGYDQKYFTNQEYVDFLSKKHEDFLSKNFKPSTEGMAEGGGAFKTLRFDNGGIASPDENLTYESKPSRFSKVASEMYENTKQSLANDYERLKNSGSARAQLAKIAALQMAGGAPDLAHLGVDFVLDPLKSVTVDKLFTKPRPRSVLEGPAKAGEKRDRVPMFGSIGEALTTKDGLPMGGSEHLIKRAQEAGLMYGKNIPIYDVNGNLAIDPETDEPYESRSGRFSLPTEIGGAILGGGALSKMRKVAGKKYQKFAEPRVDPAGALSRAIRADSDAMFNQNLRAR